MSWTDGLTWANLLIMNYELKPTPMEDGGTIYGVRLPQPGGPPRFVGWIQPLPMDGWTLFGYGDERPYFRSQGEAVDGLIERDCEEQDTTDGPVVLG